MSYRENVQKLCKEQGMQNPINEEDLAIAKLVFKNWSGAVTICEVEATDMNRAGRLYVQVKAPRGERVLWLPPLKRDAAMFFTEELWEDCSPQKRTLVYGIRTADRVDITYK